MKGKAHSPDTIKQIVNMAALGMDVVAIAKETDVPARTVYNLLMKNVLLDLKGREIEPETEVAILLSVDVGDDYQTILFAFDISLTTLIFIVRQSGKKIRLTGAYTTYDTDKRLEQALKMYYLRDDEDFAHNVTKIWAETGVSPATLYKVIEERKLQKRGEIRREKAAAIT